MADNSSESNSDREAIHPVLGVLIMVGITIFLAMVIGTFVLGLGEQVQNSPPYAEWVYEYDAGENATGDTLRIEHAGGDAVRTERLSYTVNSEPLPESDVTVTTDLLEYEGQVVLEDAGNGVNDFESGDIVRIVWTNEATGEQRSLDTFTIP